MFTTDVRKPQPTTIMELKERGFLVYILDDQLQARGSYVIQRISKSAQPRLFSVKFQDFGLLFMKLNYPDSKLAFIVDGFDYKTLGATLAGKKYGLLKETIATESHGIQTYKNNFMYHHIEDVMQWLITGGIAQYHVKYLVETALF